MIKIYLIDVILLDVNLLDKIISYFILLGDIMVDVIAFRQFCLTSLFGRDSA